MSLKILYVTNGQDERCGVSEMGRQHVAALKSLDHEVFEWWPRHEERWPNESDRPPLSSYDVVHINYHPAPLGFLQPPPVRPKVFSAFLHEPASGYQFGEPGLKFSAEDYPGQIKLWMPVPDVGELGNYSGAGRPEPEFDEDTVLLAGMSGLRQDGVDHIKPVLEKRDILFDYGQKKGQWFSIRDEVWRLANCDFLIYWYGGANQGQSAAIMTGIAAQRPLILNNNRMFDSLREYDDELYRTEDLNEGIDRVIADLKAGTARIPVRCKRDRLWPRMAARMVEAWETRL